MSNFGVMFSPIAAKDHVCEWCAGQIPKGEKHKHFQGMWGGDWQNWRMHDECEHDYAAAYGPEYTNGFIPGEGEMPERVRVATAGKEDSNG